MGKSNFKAFAKVAGMLLLALLPANPVAAAQAGATAKEALVKLADLVTLDAVDKEDQINLKENQINLMTARNSFQFPLPVAKRAAISKLSLHLELLHSEALLKNRSQVLVETNGVIVAQIALDPQAPHVVADIPLPVEFLREGYNKIQFKVAQHYTDDCEDPTAPELWTQVNSIKSYFHFFYDYQPARFTLAYLDDLFDKKIYDYELTIMRTRPAAEYNDTDLNWGGLAVQGAALRLEYKPVALHLATAQRRGGIDPREQQSSKEPLLGLDQSGLHNDAILIATRDELAPLLNERLRDDLLKEISGPYLAVFPAADPRWQIVVISGTNDAEVSMAAQAFTCNRFTLPDHAAMVVNELDIPRTGANRLPQVLQPGVAYAFKDLGFKTTTRISHKRTELLFRVPPDLLAREKATVLFKLDFAYGAALREDSVLNIHLNGLFEKAIYLDNKAGARINKYEFAIPVASFLPGLNTLRFDPVMPPLVTGKCTAIQNDNAVITLFDSSTIELPLVDHYVRLPDLKLFNRTGFPYLRAANGADLGMVVRGQQAGPILAAWQILAKLTQIGAEPLHQAILSFRNIAERHLLIIGDRKSLYSDDLGNSPVQLGEVLEFDYPINKQSDREQMGFWERLKILVNPLLPEQTGTMTGVYARMKFRARLGQDALLVGFASKQDPQRLVTVLTTEEPALLPESALRLTRPDFWDVLEDNLAVWNQDDYSLKTHKTSAEFFVGQTSLRNTLAYYYSTHRLQLLLIMLALILLAAWSAHRWLNRRGRKMTGNVNELGL